MMLQLSGIQKTFGNNHVLKGLSLSIQQGEFYSLLGPNGAGKSTSINCIAQLLKPDSGTITINGINSSDNTLSVKKILGVVPQEIALYEELTAWENLFFWGKLNGATKSEILDRGKTILSRFGLYDRKDERIKTYSGGMKRRINIAAALLHQPQLILMDEPTVGIDPQSRNNIYEFIEELKREGKTILYTTHYMEEAERFSDRIGVMDNGALVAEGTLREIKQKVNLPEHIVIEFEGNLGDTENKIKALKSADQISITNSTITISTTNFKDDLKNLVMLFNESNAQIAHLEKRDVDLETIFLKLTGKNLRD